MEKAIHRRTESKVQPVIPSTIQTTLYDLVEAVNEAAGPEKEDWVPLIVARMLKKSKAALH